MKDTDLKETLDMLQTIATGKYERSMEFRYAVAERISAADALLRFEAAMRGLRQRGAYRDEDLARERGEIR